jgi:hypothetical protein
MNITNKLEFQEALSHGRYTSVGGYPVYFITSDGGCLCYKCAQAHEADILEAIENGDQAGGWHVSAVDVNWESRLDCDNCSEQIEAAYDIPDDDSEEQS